MSQSRVAINTFSQAVSRFLIILISLASTAVLTRLFGSSGYGNYVFVTSFVLVLVVLSDFGTTTIAVRESSLDKERSFGIFGNVLGLRIILSLILFILFNSLTLFLPQFSGLRQATFIASFVLFFLSLRSTAQAILQTYLRLDIGSVPEVLASIFFFGLLIAFFILGKTISLSLLMGFWSISALLSSVLGLYFSSKYLKIRPLFQREEVKKILKESIPFGVYLLVYSIYDRGIDSFIIKTFKTSSEVGYYGLAYKVHGNLILGAAFLMNSLFPLIAGLKENYSSLKETFEKAFTLLFLTGVTILIFGFFLSPLIISVLAGPVFAPSIVALRILLMATAVSYLNHLTGYLMVALGEQRKLLTYSLIAFSLNLGLNIIFIPRFSFLAAAWVTVLTELSLFIFSERYLCDKYRLKFSFSILIKNVKILFAKKGKYFE